MSDDRPAILALDQTLRKYGIPRSQVTKDNQIKLEIQCPRCAICGLTAEQTGEILSVNTHSSCVASERKRRGL